MEDTQRKVYVSEGDGLVREMFLTEGGFRGVSKVSDADIVVFTGGADVDPRLYKHQMLRGTYINPERDARDQKVYDEARQLQKFMVGICRGSQFLNVMNGGTMWQDVSGHAIRGCHTAWDTRTNQPFPVTSTHHQESRLCLENKPKLLAFARCATKKDAAGEYWARSQNMDGRDTEAFFYPMTRSLGYQPHPEYTDKTHLCRRQFFAYLEEFYYNEEYK